MTEYKVIDISKYQGAVDYKKLKSDGADGVIIRCGYTGYGKAKYKNADSRWEENYKAAKAAGIPIGAYYYSCAVTPEEAKQEAEFVLKLIKGKTFEYPVYFDTEDNHDTAMYAPESQLSIGKKRLSEVAKAFLETLKNKGVYCGIYASKSWLENQLDMTKLSGFDVWVAQYADKLTYSGEYQMWQYTNKGRINGIETAVDINRCYVNYPLLLSTGKKEEKALKKGDKGQSVLAYKMLLSAARELGIITAKTDDNSVFGEGTHLATLELQKAVSLKQTGIADTELILKAKELINKNIAALKSKITKALEALQ